MSGVPSGWRGVPGVGYLSHCAAALVDSSDTKTARAAALDGPTDLMGALLSGSGSTIISGQRNKEATWPTLTPASRIVAKENKSAIRLEPRSSKSVDKARSHCQVSGNQTRRSCAERHPEWQWERQGAGANDFG